MMSIGLDIGWLVIISLPVFFGGEGENCGRDDYITHVQKTGRMHLRKNKVIRHFYKRSDKQTGRQTKIFKMTFELTIKFISVP